MLTEAQRTLVEQNLGLAHSVADSFMRRYNNYTDREDIYAEAYLALCVAASNFDSRRGKFSAYAWKSIFLSLIRYTKPDNIEMVSLDECTESGEPKVVVYRTYDYNKELVARQLVRQVKRLLLDRDGTGKLWFVFSRVVLSDRFCADVGRELGIGRERTRQIYQNAVRILRKLLRKELAL